MTAIADAERAFGFVDFSNIYYGRIGAAHRHGEDPGAVRVHAENLKTLLRGGRSDYRQVTVANADVPESVMTHFAQSGEVIFRESGKLTGTEQANDETLQLRMYEAMHGHSRSTLVLATGDGAGWANRRGFIPALEAARQHRWGIEVVAWGDSANTKLSSWVASVGGGYVNLDDHYYSVTFEQGGRRAQSVTLRRRPTADLSPRGNDPSMCKRG